MLVQPYIVAFMIMSSQDVLFVSFDQIFVHVVIIAFVQLERRSSIVCFFLCLRCPPLVQHILCTFSTWRGNVECARAIGGVSTLPALLASSANFAC